MTSATSTLGEMCEGFVIAACLKAGYRVLLPFGGSCRYDLLLEASGKFLRVQVKHGLVRRGCLTFRAHSSTGKGLNKKKSSYRGDVDLFGVYCSERNEVYLIPVDEVPESMGYLRIEPTKNGQVIGIKWAKDFILQ